MKIRDENWKKKLGKVAKIDTSTKWKIEQNGKIDKIENSAKLKIRQN